MGVLHFWFATAPEGIWHALTPLSIAKAVVMGFAYIAYGVVTLAVVALAVRGLVVVGRNLAKGFRQGFSGS